MKKVLVASTIKGVAGRNCLSGMFKHVNSGCDWSIRFLQDEQALGAQEVKSVMDGGIDGVIACFRELDEAYRMLADAGVPMVQIHDPDPDAAVRRKSGYAMLRNDDVSIGRLAARHFLGRGQFNSFGFVPTPDRTAWSVRRERGFRLELAKSGMSVGTLHGQSLDGFISAMPKPAAVLGATDIEALNVIAICRKLRLRVPDQVAVLGVDDDEMLCDSSRPSLSSVQVDDFSLGERAARVLDKLMRRPSTPVSGPVLVPPRGVATRESTRTIPPAARLIREGISYIRKNVASGITAKDVVRHLGVSSSLARARFASVHGRSIRDVLLDERLAVAKRLLSGTTAPLGEVARRSGFKSACRLSHFFIERLGVSPAAWRRQSI
ncbi:MAG: substrate-binding domain-containing protein [Kiritimatiellae bacterium]|nr:substrate-binding domain-containing protein [Kiritimatiellia bacterium]